MSPPFLIRISHYSNELKPFQYIYVKNGLFWTLKQLQRATEAPRAILARRGVIPERNANHRSERN